MKILNGKKLSEEILLDLRKEIKRRKLRLILGVVLVGGSAVSQIYIKQKRNACQKAGIDFKLFKFSSRISTLKLKKEVKRIAKDSSISGLIVQLPLPETINTKEILNSVLTKKDIDFLSEKPPKGIFPPPVAAILEIFKRYKIRLKGEIVIIGEGKLVGKPLAVWFLAKKIKFTTVNELTKDISSITKNADIIISGAGKPNLIKGDMVKRGVVVVDAGISFQKGKLRGDVDFPEVCKKAKYITPVPGGVGPMTVAMLLYNLVKLNRGVKAVDKRTF